ncbi:MAG: DUF1232 domain-containing protein [Chloroflexaceae bacterium]|nr:DUF1232 domain-containing protein [Chloroflexaceae bacterium]NJO07014.1 DUF1232 domain-containing protein [Chloroflexaceae bacterium]
MNGAGTDWLTGWKQRVRSLKQDIHALALALRDPRTPLVARLVLLIVVGYALSPIDLIPDVIPVLGYLDDLILLPLGLALAIRLIPAAILDDCRAQARMAAPPSVNGWAMLVIVAIWIVAAVGMIQLLRSFFV